MGLGQVTVTVTGVSGNRRQLLLTGGIAGSDERIEARYTLRDTSGKEQTITLGSLSLVSYDKKQIDLKIVPVNGATVPANLAQQINALYRQAVAGFRVEVLPNLEVEDLSGNVTFSNADNAFLSRYTSHMNKVIRTFKRAGNPLDGNTYYLFLIPNPTTDPRQGYMPINGQCGFIFLNNVSAEGVARIAAHELGHGVFRLYHTFSSDNRYVLPQGTTDNLMDYNGGTALYKYQWDYIHDPQTMLFAWAEEEEEGAMGGSWTILDKKHTLLFNHVYDNNNALNLKYNSKIANVLAVNPNEESLDLEYSGEEKEWVNQWKLRTASSDQILEKIIKKIQKAEKGKKIEKMTLKAKGIYIGKYTLDGVEYPIAVYSEKDIIDNITKVQVSEISELDKEENRKHLRAEETYIKYLVIAFYEEGSSEPVLMMQIEKFDISKLQNTKEKWLEYLGILKESKKSQVTNDQLITLEKMLQIFSNADITFLNQSLPYLNKYMKIFEINTKNRISHFLAQIGVEVSYFESKASLKENLNYTKCNIQYNLCQKCYSFGEKDNAKCPTKKGDCMSKYTGERLEMCENPDEYAGDDEKIAKAAYNGYMGRGFIHLTWRSNYESVYNYLIEKGLTPPDFVNNPKLLSENIEIAAMTACAFFAKNGCNEKADKDDFEGVTDIINKNDTNRDKKRELLSLIKQIINK